MNPKKRSKKCPPMFLALCMRVNLDFQQLLYTGL